MREGRLETITLPRESTLAVLKSRDRNVLVVGAPGCGYSAVLEAVGHRASWSTRLPAEVLPGVGMVLMYSLDVDEDALSALTGGAVTAQALRSLPIGGAVLVHKAL